ncbi:hypothetical protein [Macromonas nakdongensis]|uniref:hypothetical protein n=1 Tax=Macromonas nakdongensis TaxID=1843082 RepID=UPI000C33DA44|nr:hypothetical protein [Macromonas nakdongensis]
MTQPDWSPSLEQLDTLDQHLERALQAALDSVRLGTADALVQCCAELGPALQQALPTLAQAIQWGEPPTAFRVKLQALQKRLELLQQTQARLAASNQQALGLLFPTDQIQAYSRLGPARGPGLGSAAYLKA